MRKWRTRCSWLEVFSVISLKSYYQPFLRDPVALTMCTRKYSSVSTGDLSELALVNTQTPAQELAHHFFPVQTTTCPCFPGLLSLWVWHMKAWTFSWYHGWRRGQAFKNMKVSSIWIGNWRRGSSFTFMRDYINKIRKKEKYNKTLLSFLLAAYSIATL